MVAANFKFLKCYFKVKYRAPAYSQVLLHTKGSSEEDVRVPLERPGREGIGLQCFQCNSLPHNSDVS